MSRIADIMSTDVQTIQPQESLRRAAQCMRELDVGALPVCDGERLLGMLTDRDITVRGIADGLNPARAAAAGNSPLPALLPGSAPGGVFVGLHGSWNRKPHAGYKVVYIGFADGRPQGQPVDVLSGFLSPDGEARGRPVGVAIDARGALLVADDVGNVVWRVTTR